MTIKNVAFEDEADLQIQAKSSALEKSKTIKPQVIGDPVGQLAFVSNQIPRQIPWRAEDSKNKPNIYPYGIKEQQPYRAACTVRHRSDIGQPLNVFIQHVQCSIDNCLSEIIDSACQSTTGERLPLSQPTRINNYQTQFISSDSHTLDNAMTGHQYICCYEKNGLAVLAKAVTVLARKKNN